ncbi:contractile injection system protein, VgrG/Pvc8 family [Sphingomonas sp. 8AM]|uniref:contractile injection system protein, VgrG/Pvc8 family n=1 Tax=Sphingomonas sp. 8AM TaxID=2653170 RepID=UPI0012F1331E|nr:contractile injection system protein, VgrG/Pvc8 family [Sphingomonas sp. 8AM]VXC79982.1 Late control protein [Sphingomonas sp. 8AM]
MTEANVADYRITVDGKDLTPRLKGTGGPAGRAPRARLIGLRLSEKRGGDADQLELTLDDSDGLLEIPPAGATITVQLGWASGTDVAVGLVDKGTFVVDEIEHSGPTDQLVIRARSADLTSAIRARREHSWRSTTLGTIVKAVAARNKLNPRVSAALAGITVPALAQSRESDMALLRRLGREHDATATVKAGALIFAPIGKAVTASGAAIPGLTITRRDGDRHTFRIEKREEAGAIEAAWHDRKGAKKQVVKVGSGTGEVRRLARTYASAAGARAAAQAELGRATRAPRKLDLGLALGRLEIYPDRPVTVRGFKAPIDATSWIVSDVTHELVASRGFETALTLESAG